MAVTIEKGTTQLALINVFTVSPERQQELVDLLIEINTTVVREMSGFISSSIHKSIDGMRVTNYAQWKSREEFHAMLEDTRAKALIGKVRALAGFDPHLYEVMHVTER